MAEFRWPGWVSRHRWPDEPEGYIFLARAFDLIGEAMWSDWTGYEVEDAESPAGRRIPSAADAYIDGKPHFGFHREYGPDVITAAGAGHPNPDDPIPEGLWRAVADHNHQMFDRVRFAIARRDAVVAECHRLAVNGDLQFAWRRKGGGTKPQSIPSEAWEIDFPFVPFATLGYGEDLGLSSPVPTGWLFVTAASLDHVLGLAGPPSDASQEKSPPRANASLGDKLQAVADKLDQAGVPIRAVQSRHIREHWDDTDGPRPKVEAVTALMTGAGKGGRPPEPQQ